MNRMLDAQWVEGEIGLVIDYEAGAATAKDVQRSSLKVSESVQSLSNQGVEIFKIRAPDMIGNAMWQVMRGGRNVRVKILHRQWLEQYRQRKISILPGDGIKCRFEETISYDAAGNEVERIVCITEVLEVISPPKQSPLF